MMQYLSEEFYRSLLWKEQNKALRARPSYKTQIFNFINIKVFLFHHQMISEVPVLCQQIENRLCVQQIEPLQH